MSGVVSAVATSLGASAATAGTIADIGSAISLGSSVFGAIGDIQKGNAEAESANYNSQVAANNAKEQKQNATFAAQEGEQNTAVQQAKTRAAVGGILANEGASGVDVNTGSATDVRSSAAALGELNAINIRADAARTAYGYNVQAVNDTAQSQLDKSEASADKTAGYIGAGSTLLGGLASSTDAYQKFLLQNTMIPGSGGTADDTIDYGTGGIY